MERSFNAYKFRYEQLNKDFLPSRAAGGVRKINIYINLDDFYHRLHKPYTEEEFQVTGQNVSKQLVSNLMNLIAHYKNWAAKERMQCLIFLIYTTSFVFKNAVRIANYRGHFKIINSPNNMEYFHINQAITNGYSILQVMTKYVHNVYAIDSKYLEPSIVPLFLSREYPADFNLIVSRDEYDFQYTAFNRWAIVMPRGDNSIFLTKGNLWAIMADKNHIEEKFYFHPELFIWAKTIIGDRYREIPKLTRTGWKTVIKYLKNVSDDSISDETLDVQLNRLRDFINTKKIKDTNFNNNLYCISVKQQVDAMLDSDKAIILDQIQDMEDLKALEEVNKTVFREFPMEMFKLTRESSSLPGNYKTHDDYIWRKLLVKDRKSTTTTISEAYNPLKYSEEEDDYYDD